MRIVDRVYVHNAMQIDLPAVICQLGTVRCA